MRAWGSCSSRWWRPVAAAARSKHPEEPSARPRLVDAAGSTDKRLEVYPGDSHGWDLLYRAPYKARVNMLIFAFLHEHSQ